MIETLSNPKVFVTHDTVRQIISALDLTNIEKPHAFYTTSRRSIRKAWDEIKNELCRGLHLVDIDNICRRHKIGLYYNF